MKLLFLIIASDNPIHIQDESTQRATWASNGLADSLWLRGSETEILDSGSSTLYVDVEDIYLKILQKTIKGITWCHKNLEFDFLIRTNVSTYFDIDRTRILLSRFDSEKDFLGGHLDFIRNSSNFNSNNMFVNGGAIFLSKKTAARLREMNCEDWANVPDDFAISQFLFEQNIGPTPIPRGHVANTGILTKKSYYRMKSSSNPDMATIRMTRLYEIRNAKKLADKPKLYFTFYLNEIKNFRKNFSTLRNYSLQWYSIFSAAVKSRRVLRSSNARF
jgi:hypothetical protein